MTLEKKCPFCGKITSIEIDQDKYNKYLNGAFVQEAFYNSPLEERELIMTGICLRCQEEVFAEPKE